MSKTTPRRPSAPPIAAAVSGMLVLAACGSSDESPGDTGSAGSGSAAGFPATIQTSRGELTLKDKPERIVVAGSAVGVDVLSALGEKPDVFGTSLKTEKQGLALTPWIKGRFDKYVNGLFTPKAVPDVESVAAQKPDLIVFFNGSARLDEKQYKQLSEVAPVYEPGLAKGGWRKPITDLGALVGKPGKAKQLIRGISSQFATARKRIAGLRGKTFLMGPLLPDGSVMTFSLASEFLGELGMKPASNMTVPPSRPKMISPENRDKLTADVLLLSEPPKKGSKRYSIQDDPRYKQLPAVKNGTMLFLYSVTQNVAPTQIGPASVPWLLKRLLPPLEKSKLNSRT